MGPQEARDFIGHNKFGVLGLAQGGRAYVVPLFYAFDGGHLYFHTHAGQKDAFIDATEEACFTIVRVESTDVWSSVQVFGRLQRVPQTGRERDAAVDALLSIPLPPRWGVSEMGEPAHGEARGMTIYRLPVARVEGRFSRRPEMTRKEKEMTYGGM